MWYYTINNLTCRQKHVLHVDYYNLIISIILIPVYNLDHDNCYFDIYFLIQNITLFIAINIVPLRPCLIFEKLLIVLICFKFDK